MIRLLIVDDEPLVQARVKSMLDWTSYGIEICGVCSNGEEALRIIERSHPEIVITDIWMPVMDGLRLLKVCRDRYGELPVFLMLTGHEDFGCAREAIHYGIEEYILKQELTARSLEHFINNALLKVKNLQQTRDDSLLEKETPDRFYFSLLYGLLDQPRQSRLQKEQLAPDFQYDCYICGYGGIDPGNAMRNPENPPMNLYRSVLAMCQELCSRYVPCRTFFLNRNNFALMIGLKRGQTDTWKMLLTDMFHHVRETLRNYFNVSLILSVGPTCQVLPAVSHSFSFARAGLYPLNADRPLIVTGPEETSENPMTFDFGRFRAPLQQLLENFRLSLFLDTVRRMQEYCRACGRELCPRDGFYMALDLTLFVFHLLFVLRPDTEEFLTSVYQGRKYTYLSVFLMQSSEEVMNSLNLLLEKMEESKKFDEKELRQNVVTQVQKYMQEHCTQKLSLSETASAFGLSPNYLSTLFTKNCGYSFTEYRNHIKIEEAKKLLDSGSMKIYEIAEHLGFENAFYFSKVFKKTEGISPREYLHRNVSDGTV